MSGTRGAVALAVLSLAAAAAGAQTENEETSIAVLDEYERSLALSRAKRRLARLAGRRP